MLLKDYPVVLPDYILTLEELSPENCLFFDIETTGLSWKTSHLYLLGAVFMKMKSGFTGSGSARSPAKKKKCFLLFPNFSPPGNCCSTITELPLMSLT